MSIQNLKIFDNDVINNFILRKSLRDFEIYETELKSNDNNEVQLYQKISKIPKHIIQSYFETKFDNIKHQNLLSVDTIVMHKTDFYIKYETIDKSYVFLSDFIRNNNDESTHSKINIITNIVLAFLELKDKTKFLIINPDKILINTQDLEIKFVETGLFSYLCEENYYNYEKYDYFNFILPNNITSIINNPNSHRFKIDYDTNNLYSLQCIIYNIITRTIPYNRLIDKKTNEDLSSNQNKFDFNNKNFTDKKILNLFNNFNILHCKDINNELTIKTTIDLFYNINNVQSKKTEIKESEKRIFDSFRIKNDKEDYTNLENKASNSSSKSKLKGNLSKLNDLKYYFYI